MGMSSGIPHSSTSNSNCRATAMPSPHLGVLSFLRATHKCCSPSLTAHQCSPYARGHRAGHPAKMQKPRWRGAPSSLSDVGAALSPPALESQLLHGGEEVPQRRKPTQTLPSHTFACWCEPSAADTLPAPGRTQSPQFCVQSHRTWVVTSSSGRRWRQGANWATRSSGRHRQGRHNSRRGSAEGTDTAALQHPAQEGALNPQQPTRGMQACSKAGDLCSAMLQDTASPPLPQGSWGAFSPLPNNSVLGQSHRTNLIRLVAGAEGGDQCQFWHPSHQGML